MTWSLPTPLAKLKLVLAIAALLLFVLATVAAFTAGVLTGKKAEATSARAVAEKARADRLANENEALQKRLAQQQAITASDQRTVLNLHERLGAIDQAAADLKKGVSHVRLVASSGRDRACDGAGPAAGGGLVGAAGSPGADLAAASGAPPVDALERDRVPLTLAAVGLYDRALFVGDPGAAELAAVPCRALGSAGAAADAQRCEAAAGIYLDDLFRVHTANAQSCAADRERLGRLIDAIQARERTYLGTNP